MSETTYKGFGRDELEFQYNPRESVPEYPELASNEQKRVGRPAGF